MRLKVILNTHECIVKCTDSYLRNRISIVWGNNYEKDTIGDFDNFDAINYSNLYSRYIKYYGKSNC